MQLNQSAPLQKEARLHLQANLLDSVAMAVAAVNLEGKIILWNRYAEKLYGWKAEEVLGQKLMQVIVIQPKHLELEEISVQTHRGESWSGELIVQHRDGRFFPVHVTNSPIYDEEGRFIGIVGVSQDISQARAVEDALRTSEALFRSLSESSPVGIFHTDLQGNCLYTNPRWQQIAGISLEDSLGSGWQSALHPQGRQQGLEIWQTAVEQGLPISTEGCMQQPSGETRWVIMQAAPLHDSQGQLTGYIGTVQDITALKESEAQLRTSLQEKEVLLREIHHRVKNNMQIMISLLDFQTDQIGDPHILELLTQSQNRIRSMALVHEEMYRSHSLSQIEFSHYLRKLATDLLNAQEIRPEVVLRVEAMQGMLGIDTAIPCGLIVNELVSNALKYAFPDHMPGEIVVSFSTAQRENILTVTDNGVGLPPEETLRSKNSFGLRLVDLLTRQLKGRLQVERRQGTRFTLTFESQKKDLQVS